MEFIEYTEKLQNVDPQALTFFWVVKEIRPESAVK